MCDVVRPRSGTSTPTFTDVRLPADLDHGFEVSGTEIVFRGRCAACRVAGGEQDPGSDPGSVVDRHVPTSSTHTSGDNQHPWLS